MKRWLWILFLPIAAGVGLALGLGLSWGIFPIRMINTQPSTLSETDKDVYRIVIARDFQINGDLSRAQARLKLLDGGNIQESLSSQIVNWTEGPGNRKDLDSLKELVNAVQGEPLSNQIGAATEGLEEPNPVIPTIGARGITPVATGTVLTMPSTPLGISSTIGSYQVYNRMPICPTGSGAAVAQVSIIDPGGQPAMGIVILVESKGTLQRLVTGLNPTLGPGIVDFKLEPGTSYSISLLNRQGTPEVVMSTECADSAGMIIPGGWLIEIHL